MTRLDELNELIVRLQGEFYGHHAAYLTAVRAGDSVAASAALELLRPIGDQLQAAVVERLNLSRQP